MWRIRTGLITLLVAAALGLGGAAAADAQCLAESECDRLKSELRELRGEARELRGEMRDIRRQARALPPGSDERRELRREAREVRKEFKQLRREEVRPLRQRLRDGCRNCAR